VVYSEGQRGEVQHRAALCREERRGRSLLMVIVYSCLVRSNSSRTRTHEGNRQTPCPVSSCVPFISDRSIVAPCRYQLLNPYSRPSSFSSSSTLSSPMLSSSSKSNTPQVEDSSNCVTAQGSRTRLTSCSLSCSFCAFSASKAAWRSSASSSTSDTIQEGKGSVRGIEVARTVHCCPCCCQCH
jgi:hypothetical protein